MMHLCSLLHALASALPCPIRSLQSGLRIVASQTPLRCSPLLPSELPSHPTMSSFLWQVSMQQHGLLFASNMPCLICLQYKVKDMSQADFGRLEIDLAEAEMPGLIACRTEFGSQQPFKGARIAGGPCAYSNLCSAATTGTECACLRSSCRAASHAPVPYLHTSTQPPALTRCKACPPSCFQASRLLCWSGSYQFLTISADRCFRLPA